MLVLNHAEHNDVKKFDFWDSQISTFFCYFLSYLRSNEQKVERQSTPDVEVDLMHDDFDF